MRCARAVLVTVGLLVSGCGYLDLAGELAKTLPTTTAEPTKSGPVAELRRTVMTLRADRVQSIVQQLKTRGEGPLPKELVDQPVTTAYVVAVTSHIPPGGAQRKLRASDLGLAAPRLGAWDGHAFAKAVRNLVNPLFDPGKPARLTAENHEFWRRLSKYLEAYATKGFVDGFGAEVAQPKFAKGIGNDAITGVETVVLEFLADWMLGTPIVIKERDGAGKPVYLSDAEPTAGKLDTRMLITLKDAGLTEDKVKGFKCAVNLAGDGGLILAGAIIRTLGGANLGLPVALGKFSIGDNETGSKLIETAFQVAFRRGSEDAVYHLLTDHMAYGEGKKKPDDPDFGCLLNLL